MSYEIPTVYGTNFSAFPPGWNPFTNPTPMALTTYAYLCPACQTTTQVDVLAPQGSPHNPVACRCGACHSPCTMTGATHRPADVEPA